MITNESIFPRLLGISLLRDMVFTQSPKATARLISAVYDDLGMRWAAMVAGERSTYNAPSDFVLPDGAGAEELVAAIWPLLMSVGNQEIRAELAILARIQGNRHNYVDERWLHAVADDSDPNYNRWRLIQVGLYIDRIHALEGENLKKIIGDETEFGQRSRLAVLARGGADFDGLSADLIDKAIAALLVWPTGSVSRATMAPLPVFSSIISPEMWIAFAENEMRFPLYLAHAFESPDLAPGISMPYLQFDGLETQMVRNVNALLKEISDLERFGGSARNGLKAITDFGGGVW